MEVTRFQNSFQPAYARLSSNKSTTPTVRNQDQSQSAKSLKKCHRKTNSQNSNSSLRNPPSNSNSNSFADPVFPEDINEGKDEMYTKESETTKDMEIGGETMTSMPELFHDDDCRINLNEGEDE
jgi:hypothetical protein